MGIGNIVANFSAAFNSITKNNLNDFCFLETTDGDSTFVAKDGSLATVLKINGISQVMGREELERLVENLNIRLSAILSKDGHAIQVWFSRDPDLSEQVVKDLSVSPRGVAKKLGLNLDDVFAEREKNLPKFITWEGFYFVLWTRLSVLTKKETEYLKKAMKPPKIWPAFSDTQEFKSISTTLKAIHKSFVDTIHLNLLDVDIRSEIISAKEAIRAMRWSVYPDLLGADWQPTIIGDKTYERIPEISNYDASFLLWPRIEDQIFDKEAENINNHIVRIGDQYFSGFDMIMGPQETVPFSDLLNRMIDLDEFPWRISFFIEGNGLRHVKFAQFIASVFAFSNSDNKMIKNAIQELANRRSSEESLTIAKLKISLATWSPVVENGLRLIEERSSRLQKAVESWGYCKVSALAGDPLACVMSSSLGLDTASTAPAGAVPLPDTTVMLPWNRDSSPWNLGSVLFRTPDGRPWPYQPGSSQQDTFIDLIFAPPGKGKSVYMNTTNLALCLSPTSTQGMGNFQLPKIAIIDIGPSSSGLISLLQEALPSNRKQEVAYHRLKMSHEYSINPFDTQLGCRKPLPLERTFLINFLTALGTEVNDKPPSGLSGIIAAAVDALYDRFSDRNRQGKPKVYVSGQNILVDRAIKNYNLEVKPSITTWWEVVDLLFQRGDIRFATVAQRYAVPLLQDMMTVLADPQVMDVHGEAKTMTGEKVTNVCARLISSSVKEYPILQRPTAFELGEARVISLDLDEVAPKGGGPADKQTSLMYMLARFILGKDFYVGPDVIDFIESDYRDFHKPRFQRNKETPKRLVYDEFHRTSSSPMIKAQVVVDMREGRKFGVHLCLASQLLEDFQSEMIEMASGIWIMGVGTEKSAKNVKDTFGLNDTAFEIIKRRLHGPRPEGAPFLAILHLKDGMHQHLLYNTLGPIEIWSYSTTTEDSALRNKLYGIIGAVEARKRLAIRFPSGSAKKEIENRMLQMMSNSKKSEDEIQNGIIDEYVKEILALGSINN